MTEGARPSMFETVKGHEEQLVNHEEQLVNHEERIGTLEKSRR